MSNTISAQITALTEQYVSIVRSSDTHQIRSIAEQVADLAREMPVQASAEIAKDLRDMAEPYARTGRFSTAVAMLEKGLAMNRAAFGPRHRAVVETLHHLALAYGQMGRYDASEPLYLEAREIGRDVLGEHDPVYAELTDNLGVLYSRIGNYAAAEPLLQQARQLKLAVFGPSHRSFGTNINNLAVLYDRMGRYGEAEPLYKQALEIKRAANGPQHPDTAYTLNNLATLYIQIGKYAEADLLLREAYTIAVDSFGYYHPYVALYLNNIGGILDITRNYSEALRYHSLALQVQERVFGPENLAAAQTLNNLGAIYDRLHDYDNAEKYYLRAMKIRAEGLPPAHPDSAVTRNNLARLSARAFGDVVRAESMFQGVLRDQRKALGDNHPDVAGTFSDLAELYQCIGDYAKAEDCSRQALSVMRAAVGEDHPRIGVILHRLSSLAMITGRPAEALELAQDASVNEEITLRDLLSFGSERMRLVLINAIRGDFFRMLSMIREAFADVPNAVEWAFELVWRRKGISGEALAVQRDAVLSGRYPALQPKMRELIALRAQIARKSMDGPVAESPQIYRQTLDRWKAQRELLESELARAIPEMNLRASLLGANTQAVAQSLPTGSALVEFVRFSVFDFRTKTLRGEPRWVPARYVAFVLWAGAMDSVQMIDLGEAMAIDRLVAAYRAAITGEIEGDAAWPRSFDMNSVNQKRDDLLRSTVSEAARHLRPHTGAGKLAFVQSGIAVREKLFDPLLPVLGGRTRLFVAPDGDLARLPLEALPLDNEQFLLDLYEVSYLGVGRDVLRLGHPATGRPAAPLVAADPDFDLQIGESSQAASGVPFHRLAGTCIEGNSVAKRLNVRPWLQEQVLETPLKAARSPLIVHLATHGFFRPAPPPDLNILLSGWRGVQEQEQHPLADPLLRSGLALAGVNTWLHKGALPDDAEDGFLTAEDVTALNLLDTQMVVLSACDTGLGEIEDGEGVLGLRRAFVQAGARTLVMSLWKVPDRDTAELMDAFYQGVLEGQTRSDALRQAQLAIKAKRNHPFYWGAFICLGDPGPLPDWSSSTARGMSIGPIP